MHSMHFRLDYVKIDTDLGACPGLVICLNGNTSSTVGI